MSQAAKYSEYLAMQDQPDIEIILVHGTWARDAPWTEDSSALCRHLSTHLPSVTFRPLSWSGKNTHRERELAAKDLADLIAELAQDRPQSKKFIIGHSHGGTVAAMAFNKRPEVEALVQGVVFLSTPFIGVFTHPNVSILMFYIKLLGKWLFRVGVFSILFLLLIYVIVEWSGMPGKRGPVWLALIAVSMAPAGYLIRQVAEKAGKAEGKGSLAQLLDDYKFTITDSRRCLFIRSDGDEALHGLAMFYVAQAFSFWMFNFFLRVIGLYDDLMHFKRPDLKRKGWTLAKARKLLAQCTLLVVLATLAIFLFLMALAVMLQLNLFSEVVSQIHFAEALWQYLDLFVVVAGPVAFSLLAAMCAPLLIYLPFVLAFGRMTPASIFVLFAAEAVPPGEWKVVQLGIHGGLARCASNGRLSLYHSTIYENPECHRKISDWIRSSAHQ